MEQGFTNRNIECNICSSEIDEENGDIVGYFGVLEVAFCVWCYSGIRDMIEQCEGYNDINTLKEKINILEETKN